MKSDWAEWGFFSRLFATKDFFFFFLVFFILCRRKGTKRGNLIALTWTALLHFSTQALLINKYKYWSTECVNPVCTLIWLMFTVLQFLCVCLLNWTFTQLKKQNKTRSFIEFSLIESGIIWKCTRYIFFLLLLHLDSDVWFDLNLITRGTVHSWVHPSFYILHEKPLCVKKPFHHAFSHIFFSRSFLPWFDLLLQDRVSLTYDTTTRLNEVDCDFNSMQLQH